MSAPLGFVGLEGGERCSQMVTGKASKKGTGRFEPTARAPKKSAHTGSRLQHHMSFASSHRSFFVSCLVSSSMVEAVKVAG